MLARNTLKLIVFFFHWGVQNPSIWPIFKKCSKLVKLRVFLHINKKKNFLFLMYFWLACGKISQEHISILHKVQYFLHSDLSKISYFTVWDLKMLPSFETHHIYKALFRHGVSHVCLVSSFVTTHRHFFVYFLSVCRHTKY